MSKKTPMTPKAAGRIQSHSDKSGKNSSFKSRAQGAAAKNTAKGSKGPGQGGKPGTKR